MGVVNEISICVSFCHQVYISVKITKLVHMFMAYSSEREYVLRVYNYYEHVYGITIKYFISTNTTT